MKQARSVVRGANADAVQQRTNRERFNHRIWQFGDRVSAITTINRVVTEVTVNEIIASAACKDIGITRAINGRPYNAC